MAVTNAPTTPAGILRAATDAVEDAERALAKAHNRLIQASATRHSLDAGVSSGQDYFQALDHEDDWIVICRDLKRKVETLRTLRERYIATLTLADVDVPLGLD